jgi:hypothetical protein
MPELSTLQKRGSVLQHAHRGCKPAPLRTCTQDAVAPDGTGWAVTPRHYRPHVTEPLPDVWTSRDYPVLREVARRVDAGEYLVNLDKIAEHIDLPLEQVKLAARALDRRGLLEADKSLGNGPRYVHRLNGEAYFLTGLHPSGDNAVTAFVSALRQAADLVDDPAEKSRLRTLADGALGLSRDVLGGVLTAVATGAVGLGS